MYENHTENHHIVLNSQFLRKNLHEKNTHLQIIFSAPFSLVSVWQMRHENYWSVCVCKMSKSPPLGSKWQCQGSLNLGVSSEYLKGSLFQVFIKAHFTIFSCVRGENCSK